MRESDFTAQMPGHFVRTAEGEPSFIPDPLPPKSLEWTSSLISMLSLADRALGCLSGIGAGDLSGVNLHLLIRPFLRREAVLSSRIEGTQATLSDLFLFEEVEASERDAPDVREVSNYVRALERGREALKHRPLTVSLIRSLHQVLMENVRGGDRTPGAFRGIQVFIGATSRIQDARFIPPPPLQVEPLMAEFEQFLQSVSDIPPLVRLALIHYQFETIHPFQDGNGRIGRLLITLLLCSEGLLSLPMLYLSAYFERHRQEYYDHLLNVSRRANWNEWVAFFLQGVSIEANDAIDRAKQLMALRREYIRSVQQARASALLMRLVDDLFANPVITMKRAGTLLGLTPAAVQKHVDRLLEIGVIEEVTGKKRNRIYVARGILNALDANAEDDKPK